LQIDFDGVTLVGADKVEVGAEREALLVVCLHDLTQFVVGDRELGPRTCSQQIVY
jgi:hypothetical protein